MSIHTIDDLKAIKERQTARANDKKIMLCGGTGCLAGGSLKIKDAIEKGLEQNNLKDDVKVVTTGCNGFCAHGPLMVTYPEGVFYEYLNPEAGIKIVDDHFAKGQPVERYMYRDTVTRKPVPILDDIPFFRNQTLVALKNRGVIDPENIDEYIARDGYVAAAKALTSMAPKEIIKEIKDSGLRGRGGAGFLTGLKWELCNAVVEDEKYILCNGDEGDPGAFMDRSIMEADPHVVIEGMIIAAKAIGAHYGYIYVRAEYPLAVKRLRIAVKQAEDYGLLGQNILGSGFDLNIEIYLGAGAYVCGEETALMRSIEGKRGTPIPRPPFPVYKGVWEKPSVLNNVETLANIPQIIIHGAEWFRSMGTEKSAGTKVFALTGAALNTGLIEIPFGITLRRIVEDIGGGIKKGRYFKALQLGGPSGGCIPASLLDLPVTYEDIVQTGAIVGSGGMVVMDDTNCMVNLARFFLEFTAHESCGKCTPCRVGTKVMLNMLTEITLGNGNDGDIELLEDLAGDIRAASLCGLGQTAPNPVLTTIKYFRNEYEAHIRDKWCYAGVCKNLCTFYIDESKCTGCTACARACSTSCIVGEKKQPHRITQSSCVQCRSCFTACKFGAVKIGSARLFIDQEVPA
ncbi:NADH:ubiquinone oxidoreductase, NADH-binding (51 kD) subunit [Candidatus Magnetobacterium bavaricum]|uniref:NADH:ubiquinone oxidoreductase, NADH-binding (51 kD) subunit n=1 Tax=Candidatus Magnetobacterium bavaricum TaxID=29290 RepID=A0A0F3GMM2_9BACT|nr:NADH:ubiquinone oxidoreductase, NADH-binding (51 kD) subunit [Candidatus Magnetobacterium bavaricum]